jgi:hypothetical protein
VRPDELERRSQEYLDAIGPAPRAELLRVLMLRDFDRVGAIQTYWSNPATRTFGELLIDCEEDRTLRAVLVGMLREGERWASQTLEPVLVTDHQRRQGRRVLDRQAPRR